MEDYLHWDNILEVEESKSNSSQEPVIFPGGVRHVLTLVPLLSPANRSVLLQPGSLVTVAAIKVRLLLYDIVVLFVSPLAHRELGRT